MQGNWTVTVKSKSAAFPQQFVVQGAPIGSGEYDGIPGGPRSTAYVFGQQWSISIQNDPGTGWQASATRITFPTVIGGNYSFDILSNDAGGDEDFNDLILTCTTPVTINTFMIYGNVTLYGRSCIFNPCRKSPYIIDTHYGLERAIKNPVVGNWIKKYYPERVPPIKVDPNPPDPPYFSPIVFDLTEEAIQPKTSLKYVRKPSYEKKENLKKDEPDKQLEIGNYNLIGSPQTKAARQKMTADNLVLATAIDRLIFNCYTDPGANLTLSFEEYDRTTAEISGGPYTGEGNRRFLGHAITDMNGNYIFRFNFDMTTPGLEDHSDIAPGEDIDTVIYPDVIVKVIQFSPYRIIYESAPFYNVPNRKRINLCLPESVIPAQFSCFNGNLIGSLGNVFIGGNQNTTGSTSSAALTRYGLNYLEPSGVISVRNFFAGFKVECAAWTGRVDIKGCMYDEARPFNENNIVWYTLEIRRAGTAQWHYITENFKVPKNHLIGTPGYTGSDVGPFFPNAGGTLDGSVPAYINIQREVKLGNLDMDWRPDSIGCYMQLTTSLYDVINGVRTPGTFYLRVRGYNGAGVHVPGATDLIAMFIHNNGFFHNNVSTYQLTQPAFVLPTPPDPPIQDAGCGLFRLLNSQLHTPLVFSFVASDPYGFVDHYTMRMDRCPGTPLDLTRATLPDPTTTPFTINSPDPGYRFPGGVKSNVHNDANPLASCPGYTGTQEDYAPGLVTLWIAPPPTGDGWIKAGEYFTVYSFVLDAQLRVTNGYNSGLSPYSPLYSQIMMERINP